MSGAMFYSLFRLRPQDSWDKGIPVQDLPAAMAGPGVWCDFVQSVWAEAAGQLGQRNSYSRSSYIMADPDVWCNVVQSV